MKFFFVLISILVLAHCSKPNTVLICGDHKCINKDEAEQYFEENLSIEVKIINQKRKEEASLVELNMRENNIGEKKISITSKNKTKENIKVLSNEEIIKIKKGIKKKKSKKKFVKKTIKNKNGVKKVQKNKISKSKKIIKKNKNTKQTVVNKKNDIVDVCSILEKCSIDEISKFLLKQGKNKDFPDITTRQ